MGVQILQSWTTTMLQVAAKHLQTILVEEAQQLGFSHVLTSLGMLDVSQKTAIEAQKTASVVAGTAAQTQAVTAGAIAQTAAVTTSAATEEGVDKMSMMAQIQQDAYLAASNVYAQTSGIPVVGPFLAPVAAAAAYSAVMAYGIFEKGGILPENMMIAGHAQEMVLPAPISQGLQEAFMGPAAGEKAFGRSGTGDSGGGNTVNQSSTTTNRPLNFTFHEAPGRAPGRSGMSTARDMAKSFRSMVRDNKI
jgi:hypothetical protein